MNQERFSNLTVLNIHKERTDRLSIPPLESQTNLPTTTETEKVILSLLKYMMHSDSNITKLSIFSSRFLKSQSRGKKKIK